jgi:hypothetical protein
MLVCHVADWNKTDYVNFGELPIPEEDYKLILPMVLQVEDNTFPNSPTFQQGQTKAISFY